MSAIAHARRYTTIEMDRWGVLLAALFLTVLVGSVSVSIWLSNLGVEPAMSGSSGTEQAAAGAGWALAEVAVAVLILGAILLWRRLPEWAQEVVKYGMASVAFMWIGVQANALNAFWFVAVGGVGYLTIIKATDAYDVYWLWNNVEALVLATVMGGMIGVVLPLPFLVVGIVGLTVYDHVFANEKDWMFTLGGGMLRAKLPVVVFALPTLRVAWDDICAAVDPDAKVEDETVAETLQSSRGFGIGMADLLFPAAFASAVAVSGGGVTLLVLGITVGVIVAAFRLRWEMINLGGGAGMPALTGGMLGGYAAATLALVVIG